MNSKKKIYVLTELSKPHASSNIITYTVVAAKFVP